MVLKRIFASKKKRKEQEAGENSIMRRFHNLYFSQNITRIYKPRKMK
jgi:hypothetical protein